ncbi:MAG: hypothetical protein AAGC46_19655 [Solirubrobacteraceae bacterium]
MKIEECFERLHEMPDRELEQFRVLLLAQGSVESSAAPVAQRGGEVRSTQGKPSSRPPTAVTPGCRCGCASDVDHWDRVLAEASAAGPEVLRGALRVAYRSLRPHPAATQVAIEDSTDREKRILLAYRGWSPEDAALEELALQPWQVCNAVEVRWRADAIRKLRRSAERHPETGEREDEAELVKARAQALRDAGLSLRVVATRVGRSHMWVTRNTTAPADLPMAA